MLDAFRVDVDELGFGPVPRDESRCLVWVVAAQSQYGIGQHDRASAALLAVDEDASTGVIGQHIGGEACGGRPQAGRLWMAEVPHRRVYHASGPELVAFDREVLGDPGLDG
ncbi:MAG: hypothetical protein AUI14_24785 [Actinobacteria bacterium 13_2_20CM_2_71_6]|nr:MAG: hypothetical protein AUI14_24785 [Actinobacteria bacterium 13_2_20CM_2_71_6]